MTTFNSGPDSGPHPPAPVFLGTSACPITALNAAELLLDAVAIGPGDMLLDLATGLGHAAGLASHRGAIATGIDPSEPLLDQARRHYANALYYPGNPESLVFASGFFTAVIYHRGLQQTPSPTALAEAFRVLMPGGRYAALWLAPRRQPDSGEISQGAPFTPGQAIPGNVGDDFTIAGFTEVLCTAVALGGTGVADWAAFRISAVKPR